MAGEAGFSAQRKRPKWWMIVVIVLGHVLALYGLARAFAPDITASVEKTVVAAFTVTVTTPEDDVPVTEPEPDEGAQGDAGEKAVPKPVSAPKTKIPVKPTPTPPASADGDELNSGARDNGDGTGADGSGLGTGSGRDGTGTGGVAATRPVLIQSITNVRAFPTPPGGREARIGKSVIVKLTVSPQGRVTGCSIYQPSPFPETDAKVCELAYDQIRFEPARDRNGNPVAAQFLYRQRFFN